MSTLEINSILSTPNILSPLDSPSMMNSTIDQNPLTQSIIEHKKIVEALEKAIVESNNELIVLETSINTKNTDESDTRLLEFLKEHKQTIEPIIKEQYVEIVNILEEYKVKNTATLDSPKEVLVALEKDEDNVEKDNTSSKKTNRLFIFGSIIVTGLLGYATYSYFKNKKQ
jgi:hypothetical protein